MRQIIYFLLIVVSPTGLFADHLTPAPSLLGGIFIDRYTDTEIVIEPHRNGIRARINRGKWRNFYYRGQGLYDDCNGRVIWDIGYGQIRYERRSRRTSIVLDQYTSRWQRSSNRSPHYSNYKGYDNKAAIYKGDWLNARYGLSLSIEIYQGGIRARRPNEDWVYYDRYNDREYRDRNGNRCFIEGDELIWGARDGHRTFRFRRR